MRWLAVLLLFVTNSVAFSAGPCAATPQAAVQASEEGAAGVASVGFQVVKVRTDVALGVIWADVKRCDHPEWPGVSLATRVIAPQAGAQPLVMQATASLTIRPGETVRVWRHEEHARLEMAAVSDEGGAVGDRIRLRVATAYGETLRYCFGIVRGPANVEME